MINAEHYQKAFDVGHDHQDWDRIQQERARGIATYKRYALTVAVGEVKHVELGRARLPAHRGDLALDALLFCVHDPASALPAGDQPPEVATPESPSRAAWPRPG
jgi:hypothetical protein